MEQKTCHICNLEILVSITSEDFEKGIRPTGTDVDINGNPSKPICDVCLSRKNKSKKKLYINKILRNCVKVYNCPLKDVPFYNCDKSFTTKKDLKNHLKDKHTSTELELLIE